MRLIRQNFPDMDIHASTQMTQTGVEGAGLLYKAGAVRVVTSREMTLGEIKNFMKHILIWRLKALFMVLCVTAIQDSVL